MPPTAANAAFRTKMENLGFQVRIYALGNCLLRVEDFERYMLRQCPRCGLAAEYHRHRLDVVPRDLPLSAANREPKDDSWSVLSVLEGLFRLSDKQYRPLPTEEPPADSPPSMGLRRRHVAVD